MMTKEDYLNEYKTHKSMRDNVKRDNYRLQYHLMPPTGFLNDPNGIISKRRCLPYLFSIYTFYS